MKTQVYDIDEYNNLIPTQVQFNVLTAPLVYFQKIWDFVYYVKVSNPWLAILRNLIRCLLPLFIVVYVILFFYYIIVEPLTYAAYPTRRFYTASRGPISWD